MLHSIRIVRNEVFDTSDEFSLTLASPTSNSNGTRPVGNLLPLRSKSLRLASFHPLLTTTSLLRTNSILNRRQCIRRWQTLCTGRHIALPALL